MNENMLQRWSEVLDFWFGTERPIYWNSGLWWRATTEQDWNIRAKFEDLLHAAGNGELDDWQQEPKSCLALLVLLDQLSRNMHRGTALMFAFDSQAVKAAEKLKLLWMDELLPEEQLFVYVALMHSEEENKVLMASNGLTELHNSFREEDERSMFLKKQFKWEAKVAKEHLEVIKTFKRYPHRNHILQRESTAAERFLMRIKFNYSWCRTVNTKNNAQERSRDKVLPVCLDLKTGFRQHQRILQIKNPEEHTEITNLWRKIEKTFYENEQFSFGREPLLPVGLTETGLIAWKSSQWQKIIKATITTLKNPLSTPINDKTIDSMITSFADAHPYLAHSDMFLLCFTLYPFEKVVREEKNEKFQTNKSSPTNGWFFYRYFLSFYSKCTVALQRTMLSLIAKFTGWASLKIIAEVDIEAKVEDSVLCLDIAKIFAEALVEDINVAVAVELKLKEREKWIKKTLPAEYHYTVVDVAPNPNDFERWISDCCQHAPRYHSALDRKTGLARQISRLINPLQPPASDQQSDATAWRHTKMVTAKRYKEILRRLNHLRRRAGR